MRCRPVVLVQRFYRWLKLTRKMPRSARRINPSGPCIRKRMRSVWRATKAGHLRRVTAAGGGGIPVTVDQDGARRGVEAVIDKDRCAALLADEIHADALVIATDVPAV